MKQIAQIEERVPLLPNFTETGKEPAKLFKLFTNHPVMPDTRSSGQRILTDEFLKFRRFLVTIHSTRSLIAVSAIAASS